jgi:hypothetical protein
VTATILPFPAPAQPEPWMPTAPPVLSAEAQAIEDTLVREMCERIRADRPDPALAAYRRHRDAVRSPPLTNALI